MRLTNAHYVKPTKPRQMETTEQSPIDYEISAIFYQLRKKGILDELNFEQALELKDQFYRISKMTMQYSLDEIQKKMFSLMK